MRSNRFGLCGFLTGMSGFSDAWNRSYCLAVSRASTRRVAIASSSWSSSLPRRRAALPPWARPLTMLNSVGLLRLLCGRQPGFGHARVGGGITCGDKRKRVSMGLRRADKLRDKACPASLSQAAQPY